ncbi:putative secreted protein (IPTL-CTERM system target) [Acidovorax sp. 100]|uniref:IPTL-CTERM sorting domain-containing protein n=1 Tax=Acidovorax sp. 100 TaxID=2135635 RepID=UPI000EFA073F|nr:IPTL-CTERM sorting domain-containing protein [Acidovorax sp. 100]RMA60248.1 putative secreted protein (IPTL-CTERM system target) [Acidovorax sp. 100]
MKKYLVLLAAALLQASAWAATYTFTGPLYTTVNPFTAPCAKPTCANFTTAMRQTGSFTTAAPLAPNLDTVLITGLIQSYSFNDGLTQFDSGDTETQLRYAYVTTDAAGNIVDQNIGISRWQTASHATNDRLDYLSVNAGSYSNAYCQAQNVPDVCSLLNTDASSSYVSASIGLGGWVTSAPAAAATSVPTLSEWGLLLMACLVGGAGWRQVRRRATSRWPAA